MFFLTIKCSVCNAFRDGAINSCFDTSVLFTKPEQRLRKYRRRKSEWHLEIKRKRKEKGRGRGKGDLWGTSLETGLLSSRCRKRQAARAGISAPAGSGVSKCCSGTDDSASPPEPEPSCLRSSVILPHSRRPMLDLVLDRGSRNCAHCRSGRKTTGKNERKQMHEQMNKNTFPQK